MKISIDLETRSPVDLRKCGAPVYFEHPDTEVLMAAYRIDDGPLQLWTFYDVPPTDLWDAISAGAKIHAWNAGFEALGLAMLHERYRWPLPDHDLGYRWPLAKPEQFVDTAAAAAAMSLPRSLGDAAAALGVDQQKDKDGMRLIRKFSLPNRHGTFNDPADHWDDWIKFCEYCKQDVLTEEAIANRIVPLSDYEQRVWWLNERINSRGIRIDVMSAQSAIRLAEKAKAQLDKEMRAATNGAVSKCSEPAKLVDWVASQGIELTSAAKAEITALLETDDLPSHIRTALEIRQEAAKTSVSKLTAMMARANLDARIRQTSMYHAAGTGRFQSTGVNTSNLPRPRKLYEKAVEDGELRVSTLFEAFRSEDPEYLKFMYGPTLGRPLHLISDALRGFIWAAPDHDLVQADYTSIEGAVVAWLAGEQWKLDAMFEIMADPNLPDLYRRAAAGIMNMTTDVITKKHPLRQSVGKVSELALGYAGGVSAFYSMSQAYGVKLDELYEPVWAAASGEAREKAVKRYEGSLKRGKDRTAELTREAWIACELIKVGWRKSNARIAALWGEVEGAIRDAIQNPGQKFEAGRCTYMVRRGFLWCRLPSGRCLAYGSPKLKDQVWAEVLLDDGTWSDSEVMDREQAEVLERKGKVRIKGKTSPKATALGVNSVTKKWERFALYGGLAVENCLSAETEVLTPYGWKRITDILPTDNLWDGIEWVSHDGLVCQGYDLTIDISGVRMTPDHKVWTNDGWVAAKSANIDEVETASPDPEFDREHIRSVNGGSVRGERWKEKLVVGPMRMRHYETVYRFGTQERTDAKLRMPSRGNVSGNAEDARNVEAQSVWGLAGNDRSLRSSIAQGLRQVRRSWDSGMRQLEPVRKFLARYGTNMARWADNRTVGQQRRVFSGELCVEGQQSAGAQHQIKRDGKHPERTDAGLRSGGIERSECNNASLSDRGGVANEASVRRSGRRTPNNVEAVYDLLNAGPRNRFTVRGNNGPIIVSNCTQAVARDLLVNGMFKAEEAGYPIIATVYDEIICEVPRGFGDLAEFERVICELPDWAEGLPLSASGWRGKRYRKD